MSEPSHALKLRIQCRLDELSRLHDAVERFAAEHRIPPRPLGQLQLAVEEHVTNIIRHGTGTAEVDHITVNCRIEPDRLKVEVIDSCPEFNPLKRPAVDIHQPVDERPLGGLGVHMMRNLTDHLEYRREDNQNILVFHKKWVEGE